MRVIFRKRAEADLRQILAWCKDVAPQSAPRMLDDLYRKIDFLTRFPRTGVKVPGTPFHRAITRRYHFKIAYELRGDTLSIVGIYRFQDRQK